VEVLMSTPFIVPKKSGRQHMEPLKIKNCAFPGCKIKEQMTGKGLYCVEHRKRKYRKIIDAGKIAAKKAEEELINPNQTINHNYTNPICVKMSCKLEGCNKEFEIQVYPNVFCYPKFCKEHRNEFKRKMFLNRNK
jgi:hypothetical protein